MATKDLIVKYIKEMDEREAKKALAKLLLNLDKVGYGGYTLEEAHKEYQEMYDEILIDDLFTKTE